MALVVAALTAFLRFGSRERGGALPPSTGRTGIPMLGGMDLRSLSRDL